MKKLLFLFLFLVGLNSQAAVTVVRSLPGFSEYTLASQSAASATSSDVLDVATFLCVNFAVTWAAHSDTSSFVIQASQTGAASTWETIAGTTKTTSGAAGVTNVAVCPSPYSYMKILVTETDGGGSSTLVAKATAKKYAK